MSSRLYPLLQQVEDAGLEKTLASQIDCEAANQHCHKPPNEVNRHTNQHYSAGTVEFSAC